MLMLKGYLRIARHADGMFSPVAKWNKSGKGSTVNETIFTYLYAWVWRYHLPTKASFKVELAKICWQSSLPAVPKKRGRKQNMWKHHSRKMNQTQNSLKSHGLLPTCDHKQCAYSETGLIHIHSRTCWMQEQTQHGKNDRRYLVSLSQANSSYAMSAMCPAAMELWLRHSEAHQESRQRS